MIRSKKNLFPFLLLFFTLPIALLLSTKLFIDSVQVLKSGFAFQEVCMIIFSLLISYTFLRYFIILNTKIKIDQEAILFKSFTRHRVYKLEEIDFCIVTEEYARYHVAYETIYLVKDNLIVERISSFDYKNYDQIKDTLAMIPQEYLYINSLKQAVIIVGIRVKAK
ncbi:hypothetical protein [Sediminitomix flava]|uniref:PH (Pleckstrin Homology) domain-containing protein n=1 Tax=Sediminitomix flava TaxID=379075 RepID=A0A315ZEE6_SEDFL|nr:hypothetical protein [Sediminitomix flava]PWJ43104.1 hypothetical protein BC781_102652 [Sediminitomix flava]